MRAVSGEAEIVEGTICPVIPHNEGGTAQWRFVAALGWGSFRGRLVELGCIIW